MCIISMEKTRTPWKAILKDLYKWREISCGWIWRFVIVNMSALPNFTYRFNTIPIKISAIYLVEINKLIVRFMWIGKRPTTANTILKRKNKADEQTQVTSGPTINYINQDSMILDKNRHIYHGLEQKAQKYIHTKSTDGWQMCKGNSIEKSIVFSTNGARKIWYSHEKKKKNSRHRFYSFDKKLTQNGLQTSM